jgi:hypothetical protein
MTADRLLNLIEPQGLDRHARLFGWIAGGLAGAIVASAALLLLLVVMHVS